MIRLDVAQGTPDWLDARLGIPTASNMDRILTPKGLKPSASQRTYLHQLVAERIVGRTLDVNEETIWQGRGTELEAEAAAYYELTRGVTLETVGFCLRDDRRAGCSPDRLAGADGLVEIKCPSAVVHIGYLLDGPGDAYRLQVQGQLWVTGRAWVDFLSFCPGLPEVLLRVERDSEALAALDEAVPDFCDRVDAAEVRVRELMGSMVVRVA